MDKSHKNKENKSTCKIKPINCMFRVSKRLFDPNKSDHTSPASNLIQPSSPVREQDESPYMYERSKKKAASKRLTKVSTPLNNDMDATPLKQSSGLSRQRKPFPNDPMEHSNDVIMKSPKTSTMEVVETVMDIEEQATLSGDFSKACTLPLVNGKHPDLSTIAPETLATLLTIDHFYDITIIDCRYPYEFNAGHIQNAINVFRKENVEEDFFNFPLTGIPVQTGKLLIFYCEFSSERAPNMMRCIRSQDRRINESHYPFVYYPEMYLIEGGYKSFFVNFKELCEPQNYKPMLAKENTADYLRYKSRCKNLEQKLPEDCENR